MDIRKVKRLLAKAGVWKSKAKNRNRHDHDLFVEVWRNSTSREQVQREYSKYTPVTENQTVQLYRYLMLRHKLKPLPNRRHK